MLDVIRQYAVEKLQETVQREAAIKMTHSAYYADFLQQRERRLQGIERPAALKEIDEEIENVQAGWTWAVAQSHMELIARSLESLYLFYEAQGWYQTGEEVFRLAATQLKAREAGAERNLILGRVLARQGVFARQVVFFDHDQKPEKAGELLQASLTLLRQTDAQRETAFTLNHLGLVANEAGEPQIGQQLCQEALLIYQKLADSSGIAHALMNLGKAAYQGGEYVTAQSLWQQSLTLFREVGDLSRAAWMLNNLGLLAGSLEENPAIMKSLYLEMYAIAQESGSKRLMAISLTNLGESARRQHDYGEARRLFEDGLALFKEIGYRSGIVLSFLSLGELAYLQEKPIIAKQLYKESLLIAKEIGDQWYTSMSFAHLGEATYLLGEYQESKQHFHEAVKIALELQAIPLLPAPLLGATRLLTRDGRPAQALELLAGIRHYAVGDWQVKDDVRQLCAELEDDLPPAIIAEATERGKGRTLEEAAEMACAYLLERGKRQVPNERAL